MAQEENVFGCSYSGGGGGGSGGGRGGGGGSGSGSGSGGSCRSKKIKPKKVPQRGLGVAQLEKIISEEQQKKESLEAANILAKNAIASPTDATSFLAAQKFRPNLSPFHNSVPPPPPSPSPSPSNVSPPNALFRHAQSAPNIEILQETCAVLKHSNAGGGEMGSRAISSPRHDSFPRLWGGESNLLLEKQRLDHHGFAFDPHGSLPQRSLHFQPPPSSMVQSGISPSSVLSSHLEPPSNQSSHRNNYAPQWTEEDKVPSALPLHSLSSTNQNPFEMVGMKRSYPFSLESPPPPSLLCNFRPTYAASSSRPDELALCNSGYTSVAEPRNKCIRGSPLPNEVIGDDDDGDDGSLNGDFLTLAPPSAASPSSKLKHNHQSDYECRSSQEYERSQIHQPESSGSVRQSFNFFPIKLPTDPNTNTIGVRNGNDEEGDTIDLSLKL